LFFKSNERVIDEVYNPLKVTKSSIIEFNIGKLKSTGMYRFRKIIDMEAQGRQVARYLLYSKANNTEFVFEVVADDNGPMETYLFDMTDTIPFSDDFLDIAGQSFLTTPEGTEYRRSIMPEVDDRLEGITAHIRVYDIETDQIEKQSSVRLWDYERDVDGIMEYLNIEMLEDTGMFRIFRGELIEEVFYKFYQIAKQ
jgi:hypothetical protein